MDINSPLYSLAEQQAINYLNPVPMPLTDTPKWEGRTCLYYVVGGLASTGAVGGGMAVFSYLAPYVQMSIPSWLLGTFGGTVALVTCVGGCCLWRNIPLKSFEDSVSMLQKNVKNLTREKTELFKAREKVKEERDLLIVKINELQMNSEHLCIQMQTTSENLSLTTHQTQDCIEILTKVEEKCVNLEGQIKQSTKEIREHTDCIIKMNEEKQTNDLEGTNSDLFNILIMQRELPYSINVKEDNTV